MLNKFAASILIFFTVVGTVYAQSTLPPIKFYDNFETDKEWGIFEEIVIGSPCYGDGIGEVARTTDVALDGSYSLRVWANKEETTKSNHVIAQKRVSYSGQTGIWRYELYAYIPPETSTTIPPETSTVGQVGPEFSMQNTRKVDDKFLTSTAGIQYWGNPWDRPGSWAVWREDTPGQASWEIFTTQSLTPGEWYYMAVEADYATNRYGRFWLRGPGVDLSFNLSGYSIAQEDKGWDQEAFWLTLESENLWNNCGAAGVFDYKVYYDGVKLQAVHVWPISGTTTPDFFYDSDGNGEPQKLSSTFGPRLKASEDYRYDWHRGIDIPTPYGTPVYAIAEGEVRLAGDYTYYTDTLVQIRHYKPEGGYYYSNYTHLSAIAVDWVPQANVPDPGEGQWVDQGVLIGYSGASVTGFDHLHFEIRDGGLYQKHAVHPLLVLPYGDSDGLTGSGLAPSAIIKNVKRVEPTTVQVEVSVTAPPEELDFNRVEVLVYDANGSELNRHSFDMNEWNFAYTPHNGTSNTKILDTDPAFDGVYDGDYGEGPVPDAPLGVAVSPARFNAISICYNVDFTFDLEVPADAYNLQVVAIAKDIWGHSSIDSEPSDQQALWVWPVATGVDPALENNEITNPGNLLERAALSGVDTLYLSVYHWPKNDAGRRMYEYDDIATLIYGAHIRGMEVWASYGDPLWPDQWAEYGWYSGTEEWHPYWRAQDVIDYNDNKPSAQFDGVILDVELPSGLSAEQQQQWFENLLGLYTDFLNTLAPHGLKLAVAIPFFWNDIVEFPDGTHNWKEAYKHIIDLDWDKVVVVGYWYTAEEIIARDKDEIFYAAGKANLILVGLETQNCAVTADCIPDNSFFEWGQVALNSAAESLADYFGSHSSFGGFAIHYYGNSYLGDLTGWPPFNERFPTEINTPVGASVVVEPIDSATGTIPVTLTFSTVNQAGNTSLTTSSVGPTPPAGFKLGGAPIYYELATTASFFPPVTVCIKYDDSGMTLADEEALRLFHYEDTTGDGVPNEWVNRTLLPLDTTNNIICAEVTSLSPFAIFEPEIPVTIDIKPGSFPNSINLGSGGTVPVAIFSTITFDATTVDPTTVTLASAPVKLRGKGKPMASSEDVDEDGFLDLVVHVETEALELSQTDEEAVLEGKTFDGIPIRGVDTVRVVP